MSYQCWLHINKISQKVDLHVFQQEKSSGFVLWLSHWCSVFALMSTCERCGGNGRKEKRGITWTEGPGADFSRDYTVKSWTTCPPWYPVTPLSQLLRTVKFDTSSGFLHRMMQIISYSKSPSHQRSILSFRFYLHPTCYFPYKPHYLNTSM